MPYSVLLEIRWLGSDSVWTSFGVVADSEGVNVHVFPRGLLLACRWTVIASGEKAVLPGDGSHEWLVDGLGGEVLRCLMCACGRHVANHPRRSCEANLFERRFETQAFATCAHVCVWVCIEAAQCLQKWICSILHLCDIMTPCGQWQVQMNRWHRLQNDLFRDACFQLTTFSSSRGSTLRFYMLCAFFLKDCYFYRYLFGHTDLSCCSWRF